MLHLILLVVVFSHAVLGVLSIRRVIKKFRKGVILMLDIFVIFYQFSTHHLKRCHLLAKWSKCSRNFLRNKPSMLERLLGGTFFITLGFSKFLVLHAVLSFAARGKSPQLFLLPVTLK